MTQNSSPILREKTILAHVVSPPAKSGQRRGDLPSSLASVGNDLPCNDSVGKQAADLKGSLGESWKGWVALTWLGLSLILPLALAASEYLAPRDQGGVQGSATSVGWYFRSGQWRADVRTLAAAFQFLVNDDLDVAGKTMAPDKPELEPSRRDTDEI